MIECLKKNLGLKNDYAIVLETVKLEREHKRKS